MILLKFLSYISLLFIKLRLFFYKIGFLKSYKIPAKIISVGNISMGGTGKTPIVTEIAKKLLSQNKKVVILLRGYKRKNKKKKIEVVSDYKNIYLDVYSAGDEGYLLAKVLKVPVVVAKDRVKGAKFIKEEFNPDYIILDDGFQHLRLKRDFDIVLLTQESLEKDIFVFPAGKFREPLTHLKRADIVIITKIKEKNELLENYLKLRNYFNKKIYYTSIVIEGIKNIKTGQIFNIKEFENKEIGIFCGIAYPEYFEDMLKSKGLIVSYRKFFSDHHYYSKNDLISFKDSKVNFFITTQKDSIKINQEWLEEFDFEIYELMISYKLMPFFND